MTDKIRIRLPKAPREVAERMVREYGYDVTMSGPTTWGRVKDRWSAPNSKVSQATVPDYGQAGNECYHQAHLALSDADPEEYALTVFKTLMEHSLEQAAARHGVSNPADLPEEAHRVLAMTSATEATKRIWTTATKEKLLADALPGEPLPPEDYAEAVAREKDGSADIVNIEGNTVHVWQEKSEAGDRKVHWPHIWAPNLEDWWNEKEITVVVE